MSERRGVVIELSRRRAVDAAAGVARRGTVIGPATVQPGRCALPPAQRVDHSRAPTSEIGLWWIAYTQEHGRAELLAARVRVLVAVIVGLVLGFGWALVQLWS